MAKNNIFLICAALLLACMLLYTNAITWHWLVRHDNGWGYYVGYQILHGATPYRDFFALDMPVTMLIHALGIALFGEGDNGHRMLYSAWQILIIYSSAAFFGKYARLFGILAGLFYALYHLATGIDQMLQREYLMLPFLLLAGYFMLREEKFARLHPAFFAGILLALAFMTKPTAAIYGIFIILIRAATLPRRDIAEMLAYAATGGLLVIALILSWLACIGGLQDFIATMTNYLPIYQSIGPRPAIAGELQWLWPYMVIACVISLPLLAQKDARTMILVAGCIYGLLHYFLQSFSWPHRLVPARFFFTLLCFYCSYYYALTYGRMGRACAMLFIICACWVASPFYWNQKSILDRYSEHEPRDTMIAELRDILQSHHESTFQFFDITEGFFYASTALRTTAPSRCNYPPLLYYANENPYVAALQNECLSAIEKNAPAAIAIISDSYPFFGNRYRILGNARLANLLATRYQLAVEERHYRIYSRIN